MELNKILSESNIAVNQTAATKRDVLEAFAQMLSTTEVSAKEIYSSLNNRERLGSTGMGRGVAIPHGRINGITSPIAALIKLTTPVAFDAADSQPVDLLVCLMVPADCTDEHLALLANVAEIFAEDANCVALRAANTPHDILTTLN